MELIFLLNQFLDQFTIQLEDIIHQFPITVFQLETFQKYDLILLTKQDFLMASLITRMW